LAVRVARFWQLAKMGVVQYANGELRSQGKKAMQRQFDDHWETILKNALTKGGSFNTFSLRGIC